MTEGFATSATGLLGIRHPIVAAPMAGMTTGRLAGTVARAGALGLIGVGSELFFDGDWVREEYAGAVAAAGAQAPGAIGFGFITCLMKPEDAAFRACLDLSPGVLCLAYGDDHGRNIAAAHEAGALVICQVHTIDQARAVIAGGVMDGRGLAAALVLGASGVVMGTRFVTSEEANIPGAFQDRIVETQAGDTGTIVTSAFDILGPTPWTPPFRQARALSDSETVRRFHRPVGSPQHEPTAGDKAWYEAGDFSVQAVWASAAAGLAGTVEGAALLVERTIEEATSILANPTGPEPALNDPHAAD